MHPNKNITAPLISLFIIPLIIGDALVLGNVNSKTSILIIAPIIFILLTIFLITLYKITKQALFQYDNIFTELGFHKKRLYLILTTYEKNSVTQPYKSSTAQAAPHTKASKLLKNSKRPI